MKHTFYTFILIMALFNGCKNPDRFHVETNQIDADISFVRFDKELGKLDNPDLNEKTERLRNAYPDFYNLYATQVIRIGPVNEQDFLKRLESYLSDSVYKQVFDTVSTHFTDMAPTNRVILNGFKRYMHFFPEKPVPDVYYHISGFNESVVVTPEILAISLDNYLGQGHTFYKWLALYEYLRKNMYHDKIPSDALWAWLATEFSEGSQEQNLLNKLIHHGKIRYLLQHLLPDEPLWRIHSYTPEQMEWCKKNEAAMWSYIIEYKHLFSKDPILIKKYTDDGPFTHYFGNNSAPRAGSYIGWKIVSAFMNTNKEVTLDQLMLINNGSYILEQSRYRP